MGLSQCGLNLNRRQQEMQPHGTEAFPCAAYFAHYGVETDAVIPWHWHEEIEILYVKSGVLNVQIPTKQFRLSQGEGFVINSNVPHYASADPDCELQSLLFHSRLISGAAESVFADKYLAPLLDCSIFDGCTLNEVSADSPAHFRQAFEALADEPFGFEFAARHHLSALCLALYQRFQHKFAADNDKQNQDNRRIRKMLDYIHGHFVQDIKLADIAAAADIGERESLRCFQRTLQTSPMQYLLKYRANHAADLLANQPAKSIALIAAESGFDSPSHFAQIFKRFYNRTPREYRKAAG
ncbi:AraC family transcriptional regulator [Testudinibacter sp. TR-2022]|uniref:AraC family transcriptional regulator n=1 Tax=Testudinibacter sp. TR-2022 TaxID=2585029 RepID=UPI001119FBD1|nr:helix-turn-helix transcriptional regulator [Testudinibacter sp. TR-2022]TNH04033.1 AraC family transcriptional regulator [Pasteurellaceae bacterium Phil11]TNH24112.1 AraC family transcriptional regulator [Testudinibacter sp. TR-2022]TNH27581.1 AraC family transcriptional regulator [Testudinibacter sp. TR-2022]